MPLCPVQPGSQRKGGIGAACMLETETGGELSLPAVTRLGGAAIAALLAVLTFVPEERILQQQIYAKETRMKLLEKARAAG